MWRMAWVVLAAGLPATGFAQDAVIRIEAKRGEAAASQAAASWRKSFEDVVTFPLSGGWIGVGLGPQAQGDADARLRQLKAAGSIPADSFVAVPQTDMAPVEGAIGGATSDMAPSEEATAAKPAPETAIPELVAQKPEAGTHIRLESLQSLTEAENVLDKWRKRFPGAGLWHLPGGWYAVTIGPMPQDTARVWLGAFKSAGVLPKDAFTSDSDELGDQITPGSAPDLPVAGQPERMPPLPEVQKALRWAGYYEGGIDGKSGPMTRAAINAEIVNERLSADPGTAMRKLMERRAAWRDEMGLTTLKDDHTGLSVAAPMDKLQFDRSERALSIYGPKDDSGAALILFSQPGGQQELLDLSGLVTALGWVPQPERTVTKGHVILDGRNDEHHGRAEGWVRDGRAEGFVLIWPTGDPQNLTRLAAEISDSLTRSAPAASQADSGEPAQTGIVTGQP